MSRDKQIEEMRNIMEMDCDRPCAGCELEKDDHCFTHIYAIRIYNAGYRKQRDAKWVDNHCTACGMTPIGEEIWTKSDLTPPKFERFMDYCPNCGAHMKGANDEN